VAVSFSPTWFRCHYGIDYSECTWGDPIGRVERNREQARLLHERFGDVGLGSSDPPPQPSMSDAYGNYFMPALFGCPIVYPPDQAPANLPLSASFDDMAALQVPDLATSPVVRRAMAEARALQDRYGCCSGAINTGSPINVAVNLYGEQFLLASALAPAIARHVLYVIAETEFRLYRELSSVVDPASFPLPEISFGYGNCPAVMFSPRIYREVVLPVDRWVRRQVAQLHLHHCGVFDDYIELYRQLDPASLDIGGGSDYRRIRAAFPDTPFSLIVNAPDVEGHTVSQIDGLVGSMVEGAAPVARISHLWCAEVSERTADDTVRALRTAHQRLAA
jgi:hypothetical protein